MTYTAAATRYDAMTYRRCGRSGITLPAIALGLWHNFGRDRPLGVNQAVAAEVVPEAQGDSGQLDSAAPAAAVGHRVIAGVSG